MGLDVNRVVECMASADGISYAAGYRISANLVLTVSHLFGQEANGECLVRGAAGKETISARAVVDLGPRGADVALLQLDEGHDWPDVAPVRFGQVVNGVGKLPFNLVGWPRAAASFGRRDSVELTGRIALGSNLKSGLLKLYLDGPHPLSDVTPGSPWAGISGAAVFARNAVVGVVREHLTSLGVDQLDAEPLGSLLDDAEATRVLGADGVAPAVLSVAPQPAPEELGPPLELKLVAHSPATIVNFRARATSMIGRDHELQRLRAVLADDRPFSWQLVTGPGGSGKSRLALELCVEAAEVGWDAGFLIPEVPFEWHRWLPSRPTLIVVDEQEYRRAAIREIITVLAGRSSTLTDRVRLMLLGREESGRLERSLAITPMDWDAFFGDTSAGAEITLGPLSEEDSRRLASEVSGEDEPPPLGSDPVLRLPLYAVLAASVGEAAQPGWDSQLLGRYVLQRNRMTYWREMTAADEAALAYACITQDPSDAIIRQPGLPELADVTWESLLEHNREITGTQGSGLSPLEPGPVGELFVLELLAQAADPATTVDVGHRAAATAFGLTQFANEFVLRCWAHFPSHRANPRLTAAMVEFFDASTSSVVPFGMAVLSDSAGQFAEGGPVELAFAHAEAARILEQRPSAGWSLTMAGYTSVLFALVNGFGESGNWPALRRTGELMRAAAAGPDPAFDLRRPEEIGKGYGNAVKFAQEAGENDLCRELIRAMLAVRQTVGAGLDVYVANALVDAVKAEPEAADALELVRAYLVEIEADQRGQVANALFNVVNRASRELDAATAISALDQLQGVANTSELPDQQVVSRALISFGSSASADIEAGTEVVDRLLATYDDPDDRFNQFIGLSNALWGQLSPRDAVRALRGLCALAGTFDSEWSQPRTCLQHAYRLLGHGVSLEEARDALRLLRTQPTPDDVRDAEEALGADLDMLDLGR